MKSIYEYIFVRDDVVKTPLWMYKKMNLSSYLVTVRIFTNTFGDTMESPTIYLSHERREARVAKKKGAYFLCKCFWLKYSPWSTIR